MQGSNLLSNAIYWLAGYIRLPVQGASDNACMMGYLGLGIRILYRRAVV